MASTTEDRAEAAFGQLDAATTVVREVAGTLRAEGQDARARQLEAAAENLRRTFGDLDGALTQAKGNADGAPESDGGPADDYDVRQLAVTALETMALMQIVRPNEIPGIVDVTGEMARELEMDVRRALGIEEGEDIPHDMIESASTSARNRMKNLTGGGGD